jgi:hypothetical protein
VAKPKLPEISVRFYCTATGREPVLEWLRSLAKEDRRVEAMKARDTAIKELDARILKLVSGFGAFIAGRKAEDSK